MVVFSHFLRAFILKHAMSVANRVVKEHEIFTVMIIADSKKEHLCHHYGTGPEFVLFSCFCFKSVGFRNGFQHLNTFF
jgi:hypothetical protein